MVNTQKSRLKPVTVQTFLNLVLNFELQACLLPENKLNKVVNLASAAIDLPKMILRKALSVRSPDILHPSGQMGPASVGNSVFTMIAKKAFTREGGIFFGSHKLPLLVDRQGKHNIKGPIALHIKRAENTKADFLSCNKLQKEWTLNSQVLQRIIHLWGWLEINLFADKQNSKVKKLCSRNPRENPYAVDALQVPWDFRVAYVFPPIAMIPVVARNLREDQARVILIAPFWPKRPRFSPLRALSVSDPWILPEIPDLLTPGPIFHPQQIDDVFQRKLPEVVVELLMTLHESPSDGETSKRDFLQYTRELDPAPNPPYFPSSVIKATLNYISSCHKSKQKSLISILSKTPDAYQKILLSICKQAAESNNIHKKHRILIIYHLFVDLVLEEIKDGLGGAWAFVLRDVIYTLIHHINNRAVCPTNDVCTRSTMLCLDLLHRVCRAAVAYCKDALESHLHVIVGSLIPLANCQTEIQQQVYIEL
ncbi:unnamed protein product [Ranitomeya imitator]|uniref:Uncharacterized protein n=1 Tax=Ranitomeya imitator TaxID=111125 RepID=A0ABN9LYX6_9NEOB|nr:unnamed protein product [Ranitomeya imitator]